MFLIKFLLPVMALLFFVNQSSGFDQKQIDFSEKSIKDDCNSLTKNIADYHYCVDKENASKKEIYDKYNSIPSAIAGCFNVAAFQKAVPEENRPFGNAVGKNIEQKDKISRGLYWLVLQCLQKDRNIQKIIGKYN